MTQYGGAVRGNGCTGVVVASGVGMSVGGGGVGDKAGLNKINICVHVKWFCAHVRARKITCA